MDDWPTRGPNKRFVLLSLLIMFFAFNIPAIIEFANEISPRHLTSSKSDVGGDQVPF